MQVLWNVCPAFSSNGKIYVLRPTVRCSVLHSEGGGRLDFGGQDLPEPPLQLLHVGRFGSCQVEAASSFLSVYSPQSSEHLKHTQRCDVMKLTLTCDRSGYFKAACTCLATCGQQNKL